MSLLLAAGLPASAASATSAGKATSERSLSGASFHAWMGATDTQTAGWYDFSTDGSYSILWSNIMSEYGINLNNAWMRDGLLCGLGVSDLGGLIIYNNYVELDPTTGRMHREVAMAPDNLIDMTTYYESCAYVAADDHIYGFIQNSDVNDGIYNFCCSPASNPADITVIAKIAKSTDRAKAMCYNPTDNGLYGVSYDGEFIKISLDGEITPIFNLELDNLKNAKTALAYSPFDGCFMYTPMYYEYATQLYHIYPEEKRMRFIRNFPTDNQFFVLLNDDFTYNAESPAMPTLVSEDFVAGALEGSFTLKMPATTLGGGALSGTLDYSVFIDNVKVSAGNANAGSDAVITVGPLENGEHVLRVSCRVANGPEGAPIAVTHYFGNGMPLAPEEVTMTETSVSWTPVTEAELGGYLEPGKMRYEVYINDRFIGSTDATSMDIELDPEITVQAYHAYVAASCNGQVSERTESNKIIFGAPLPLPYTVVPTKDQAEITATFNEDGSPEYGTWQYWETRWGGDVFASGWSYESPDDWLILPPVDCADLSHAYRVTLEAIAGGSPGVGDEERFEVWCGNAPTPEAMTTLVIPETRVKNYYSDGWEVFSNVFVPKSAGATYVAVRAVSEADQYSLVVRNIKIEATDIAADVPAAPSDLTLKSKSDADLTATITFTMPTETITGNVIPADADLKVTAAVGDNTDSRAGRPGETIEMTVDTKQGDNRVVVYCTLNGQAGQETSVTVYTGTIPPNFVENLSSEVSRDNMSVRLTWEPPLGGQENLEGYYSPEGMHYWLMELDVDTEFEDSEWVPTKDLGNVLEYTYELPAGTRQAVTYLAIAAANEGGISGAIWYVYPVLGTPYKPEIVEDFVRGNGYAGPKYTPVLTPKAGADYDSEWNICMPEDLGSELWDPEIPYAFINFASGETAAKGRLQLPKFSTEGLKTPGFTLTSWTSAPCGGPITVYASTYGKKMTKIAELIAVNDGWHDYVIPLSEEYQNMPWIQLTIDTTLPDPETYAMIGGYRFGEVDLSGVSEIDGTSGKIFGGIGEIVVGGYEGESVSVYSLDGRLCAYCAEAASDVRLKVAAGIYTVVCGGETAKVIVR